MEIPYHAQSLHEQIKMEICLIERLDTSIEEGEKKLRDTVITTVSFIFEKRIDKMHDSLVAKI